MKKDLNELKRLQVQQAGELRAMADKAEAEKRELTPTEAEHYDKVEKEIEARKIVIEREERLQELEMFLARPRPTTGRPDPEEEGKHAAGSIRQEEIRCMVWQKDGTYKEGRAIDPIKEFRTFGEQMKAIVDVYTKGVVDPRLSKRAVSGLSETVPSDGGFLVQQDFSAELFARTYELGEILSRCRRVPIGANSNGLKVPAIDETSRATGSRWGGVQVFRANEGDAATAKKPKFRMMELNLKKLIGLAYATDELLQDSTALESVLMQAFPEEFSFTIEDEIINGTGAGQMAGILTSASLVTVTKEASQPATTFKAENAMKMWSRMWSRSRRNAVWFINQDVEPQLFQMVVVVKNVAGTENVGGSSIFMPPGGLSASPYGTMFNRPVIAVEYCSTLGTKGDVLLLDLSQYLVIDKGGLQAASSIHVRFLNDENTFRWTIRNDGQPVWNNPLTPYKGSNIVSPFICVETRS